MQGDNAKPTDRVAQSGSLWLLVGLIAIPHGKGMHEAGDPVVESVD